MQAIASSGATRLEPSSVQRSGEAVGHHGPAATERATGAPDVGAADAVEDGVHAVPG